MTAPVQALAGGMLRCPVCAGELVGRGGDRQDCPACGFFVLLRGNSSRMTPARYGLTPKQKAALDFLAAYQREHGMAPSYEEFRRALGLASKGSVNRLLILLEERGHIRRLPDRARAIEIIDGGAA